MRKVAAALIVTVGLGILPPAQAADLATKRPVYKAPAPVVYDWTGFYVGGHVGAAWMDTAARWDPLPSAAFFNANTITSNLSDTAFVGGVHIGYDWQVAPQWVLGVEGDWSWTNARENIAEPWTFFGTTTLFPGTSTSLGIDFNWLATVRGRIGYLVTPAALLYFTGGAAWADVDYAASAVNTNSTYNAAASFSRTVNGYVLGGGLEWALAGNWRLRGEYLYYRLNTVENVVAVDPTFFLIPSSFTWDDTDIHTVRVGLSYKFGAGNAPVVAKY